MSKNHSIAPNRLYFPELIMLSLCAAGIFVVLVIKFVAVMKPAAPPASLDIQQLELQKAINLVQEAN